jgi:predicted SnoaL-like aldol condensation-catalyzing enzyme
MKSGLEDTNKAIVGRLLDEVYKGNLGVIDELCSKGIVNHSAIPELQNGIEGFKEVVQWVLENAPHEETKEREFIADGDKVVVHEMVEGTWNGGEFMGFNVPAGKATNEVMSIWRLADGKIVERWACRNDLGMLQQLGAIKVAT